MPRQAKRFRACGRSTQCASPPCCPTRKDAAPDLRMVADRVECGVHQDSHEVFFPAFEQEAQGLLDIADHRMVARNVPGQRLVAALGEGRLACLGRRAVAGHADQIAEPGEVFEIAFIVAAPQLDVEHRRMALRILRVAPSVRATVPSPRPPGRCRRAAAPRPAGVHQRACIPQKRAGWVRIEPRRAAGTRLGLGTSFPARHAAILAREGACHDEPGMGLCIVGMDFDDGGPVPLR